MRKDSRIRFSLQDQPLDPKKPYYCTSVTNSMSYSPGEYYSKETVDMLCNNRYWNITIVTANCY